MPVKMKFRSQVSVIYMVKVKKVMGGVNMYKIMNLLVQVRIRRSRLVLLK